MDNTTAIELITAVVSEMKKQTELMKERNELLDAQNEILIGHNEELAAQNKHLVEQNEMLQFEIHNLNDSVYKGLDIIIKTNQPWNL